MHYTLPWDSRHAMVRTVLSIIAWSASEALQGYDAACTPDHSTLAGPVCQQGGHSNVKGDSPPVAAMYSAFSASSCSALAMQEATCDARRVLPPALFSSSCMRLQHVARSDLEFPEVCFANVSEGCILVQRIHQDHAPISQGQTSLSGLSSCARQPGDRAY
jgi:hypothetical protein